MEGTTEQIEIQRRIFITVAGFVLLSVILMIIIIPSVLQDTSAGAEPKGAAIGIAVLILLQLIVLLGFLKSSDSSSPNTPNS